ncbi:hypothetical protein BCR43DRAFT_482474 [Syncephalastrum racemosum]|uniref:UBA domain-containing protein n=1 Tax=Syncephalastrum racemosum TaxID=13706 RepID=A0A1X2HTU9_SYNRA|nr:hypothetical protein BCR43DRAFT_482474 [Syncephalastrum racemosum]
MFGKRPAESRPDAKPFDVDNIDDFLQSTLADIDQGDDEAGLDDPDLLRQLQELDPSSATKKKQPQAAAAARVAAKPRQQPNPDQELDLDSYAALAQDGDVDEDVQLDDNDLNDPGLLGELSKLSKDGEADDTTVAPSNENTQQLMSMGFSPHQAQNALEKYDGDLERATNFLLDASQGNQQEPLAQQPQPSISARSDVSMAQAPGPEPDVALDTVMHDVTPGTPAEAIEDEESFIQRASPEEIQRQAQHYQKLALAAKRQGDKKKAVEYMRHSKAYSSQLQQKISEPVRQLAPEPKEKESPLMETDGFQQQPAAPSSPATSLPPVPSAHASTRDQNKLRDVLNSIIKRQKEYKDAAVHYKNIGNLSLAKDMVVVSKDLLRMGIHVKQDEAADLTAIEQKIPAPPDLNQGDGKIRAIQQVEPAAPTTLEHLESQLTYQIDVCHNLAIQNAHKPKASGKVLSDASNHWAELEQAFTADLVSLRSRRDQQLLKTPQLHYEQVQYMYKNVLDHIAPNQMELKIVRGTGLQSLDISSNVEPYVAWDFGGWPPENTAQAPQGKGETPIQKSSSPEFNFVAQIPIARGNRLFHRYVQRKKLTLEVFHNRYTYGFFRRPILLGKSLQHKTSISGMFELTDGSRRKTGGKIEVHVNLREPLTGEDAVKRAERWLVIDEFSHSTSQLLAAAGLSLGAPPSAAASSAAQRQPSPTNESLTPTTPSVIEPKSVTASAPPRSGSSRLSSAQNDELQQAEDEFNSVDSLVSNMVLEHETNAVAGALSGGGGGGSKLLSGASKDDLMDRKQALDIKMNMLVIQVQTGMLDMDTYLDNVRKRMERDRELAVIFKKHNRLDLAKAALTRKKIMQNEVEEAAAAMAAGEGDGGEE